MMSRVGRLAGARQSAVKSFRMIFMMALIVFMCPLNEA
jgi:hypothetical protein